MWVLPLFALMAAAIPLVILTIARRAEEKYERGEILVCEANACRRAGAQALLTEIEEKVIFDYSRYSMAGATCDGHPVPPKPQQKNL